MKQACPYISWISPYVDGELTELRRAELQRHLAVCDHCKHELAEVVQLSQTLQLQQPRPLLPIAKARLHRQVDAMADRSLLRFAELLTGLAAAVLIATSVWLLRAPVAEAQPPSPWEEGAVILQPEPTAATPSLETAKWIVSDLSRRQSND